MSFAPSVYAARRERLAAALPASSALLLPGARLQQRNRDCDFPFRQHSDFLYLSGFQEPDAWLLLEKNADGLSTTLFVPPKDLEKEIWTGYRAGPEKASALAGAERGLTLEALDEELPRRLAAAQVLYYPFGVDAATRERIFGWRRRAESHRLPRGAGIDHLENAEPMIHELRLLKSETELELMRRAAEISAAAHSRLMSLCRPGLHEYQLEAELQHQFGWQGARFPAYASIVAGGANACVLHYTENDAPLKDGDLVLVDAGCEVEGYASDITRTFPVNGRFSKPQRALYSLVLAAQRAAFAEVRPGADCDAPHRAAVRELTHGLVDLGLLEGDPEALVDEGAYRAFYMHRTSHWLGLDVHDVGSYRRGEDWRPLEPGMVLTIEPGLYIASDREDLAPHWRGLGIRIEDDVLVTAEGYEVLTGAVPREIDAIEALMESGS